MSRYSSCEGNVQRHSIGERSADCSHECQYLPSGHHRSLKSLRVSSNYGDPCIHFLIIKYLLLSPPYLVVPYCDSSWRAGCYSVGPTVSCLDRARARESECIRIHRHRKVPQRSGKLGGALRVGYIRLASAATKLSLWRDGKSVPNLYYTKPASRR